MTSSVVLDSFKTNVIRAFAIRSVRNKMSQDPDRVVDKRLLESFYKNLEEQKRQQAIFDAFVLGLW